MPDHPPRIQFIADRGDARLTLDQVLVRRVTAISRLTVALAADWIRAGHVAVDGRAVRAPEEHVAAGAAIVVTVPTDARWRSVPQAEPVDLAVLYEDEALLAVDKPPGLVVHPSYKQASGTLLNGVLWRLRGVTDARPGILTRLDKDTSGVVIVALTPGTHATLQQDAAAGRVLKEYLALTSGVPVPAYDTIREPLARDPADRRRVIVSPGGAMCATRYQVLAIADAGEENVALVRCELVTGRTHQIRVHLASRGCPVLGDRAYGSADARLSRQALHAWRVTLPHPLTRQTLTIQAPWPDDITETARTFGIRHGDAP